MGLKELNISRAAFWDVDYTSLDAEYSSIFIIGKVLAFGSYDDIQSVFRYYGINRIKKEVKLSNSLDPKTLNFFSKVLDINPTEFSCYKRIQFLQNSGSYYSS